MCWQLTAMSNCHKNREKWRRTKLIKPVWGCREKRDVQMNQLQFLILISGNGKGKSLKVICFIDSQRCSWFMWHFWDSVCFNTASELWSTGHPSGRVYFVSVVVVRLWQSAQALPFTQTKEVFLKNSVPLHLSPGGNLEENHRSGIHPSISHSLRQ